MSAGEITSGRLDAYANSMFAHERPHPRWISSCAAYLSSIFGDRLRDSVVIDYGFGRGNWALAFRQAGARRVMAIDASISNVRRLSEYCQSESISGIQVVHGNIVETPLNSLADIVWLYGVLPCVSAADVLLERLAACLSTDSAELLVYAYDAGSLRQAIVDACRRGILYDTYNSFLKDALLFSPPARTRARDDLTAPYISWHTARELAVLVQAAGLVPIRKVSDFALFLGMPAVGEFDPHHFVCRRAAGTTPVGLQMEEREVDPDVVLLGEFATRMVELSVERGRDIAIGLFNTHFAALGVGGYSRAVIDDFLYLLFASETLRVAPECFGSPVDTYRKVALAAIADSARTFTPNTLRESALARYLVAETIRL